MSEPLPRFFQPALGRFTWRQDVAAWCGAFRIALRGRTEEIALQISRPTEAARRPTNEQLQLATRLVGGRLAERWPEVQHRLGRNGDVWDFEARWSRVVVRISNGATWQVETKLDGEGWLEARFEDPPALPVAPPTPPADVLDLLQAALDAPTHDELTAALDELGYRVSEHIDPMSLPNPPAQDPGSASRYAAMLQGLAPEAREAVIAALSILDEDELDETQGALEAVLTRRLAALD